MCKICYNKCINFILFCNHLTKEFKPVVFRALENYRASKKVTTFWVIYISILFIYDTYL